MCQAVPKSRIYDGFAAEREQAPSPQKAVLKSVPECAPLCYRTPQRGAKPRSGNGIHTPRKFPPKNFIFARTLDPGAFQPFQNFS